MSKKKRIPFVFTLLDYKAMEEYFEIQASKGWMLDKINSFTMEFIKIKPKQVKFSVDVFPYISAFDSHNTRTVTDYRNLCEDSGWTFVTSSNKLQVFSTEDMENTLPIQTDPIEEERIIKKSFYSSEVLMMFILFPILLLSLGGLFPPRYDMLFLNSKIVHTIMLPLLFIPVSIYATYYGVWFFKARANARKGLPLPRTSVKSALLRGRVLLVISGLVLAIYIFAAIVDAISGQPFFLFYLIIPVAGVIIGLWFKKKGLATNRSRGKNIIVFMLLIMGMVMVVNIFLFGSKGYSNEKIKNLVGISTEAPEGYNVIKLKDLGLIEEPSTKAFSKRSSIVVPNSYEYHELSSEGTIRTHYYEAINKDISQYIFEGMLDREGSLLYRSVSEASHTDWQVDRAYYLKEDKSMILLLKDNIVLMLEGEVDFSNDHIVDISRQELGL